MKLDSHSLSTVANSDKFFVKRDTEIHVERLSLKGLTHLLVLVKDLLNSLERTPSSRGGVRTLVEGNELLDLHLDETSVANLEHLLLCLRDQLLRLLVAKLVELVHRHVIECQRDQDKHGEEWFFEFPSGRRPLSTTWPWSIRPSLAVLWGVCWMFYDFELPLDAHGNMVNEQGQIVLSRADLQQYLQNQQRQNYYRGERVVLPDARRRIV